VYNFVCRLVRKGRRDRVQIFAVFSRQPADDFKSKKKFPGGARKFAIFTSCRSGWPGMVGIGQLYVQVLGTQPPQPHPIMMMDWSKEGTLTQLL